MDDNITLSLTRDEVNHILECIADVANYYGTTAITCFKKDDMNGYRISRENKSKAWLLYKKIANMTYGVFKEMNEDA